MKSHKFIEAVAPQAAGVMMLNHSNNSGFPIVKGVELDLEAEVVPLYNYVVAGNLENLDDESIILGSAFAREVGAMVGSTVDLYSPLMLERMKQDEIPPS